LDEQKPEGFLSAFKENSHLEIVGICKEIDSPPSSPSDGPLLPIGTDQRICRDVESVSLAVSKEEKGRTFGWSGPLPSPEAAIEEAITNCKKRGGTDPPHFGTLGGWDDRPKTVSGTQIWAISG
jgi:hypothetical protein